MGQMLAKILLVEHPKNKNNSDVIHIKTSITNQTRNVSIGHGCPHFHFFATESKSHNDYSG